VKELGVGLEADSWSTGDNVVESFRHSDLPIFGVQWHPERMSLALERADTVNGLPVFEFFCTVCGGDPDRHRSDAGMLLMEDGAGI
jgi:putative glutamine amidotransferase